MPYGREESCRLAVEANIKTPRTLETQQQFDLITTLKPFAGQRFTISVSADEDSLNLVEVIKGILQAAGWLFIPSNNLIQISGKPYTIVVTAGVRIRVSVSDYSRFENVALFLSAALRSQGIWSQLEVISDPVLDNAINIAVGSKPLAIPQRQPQA